MNKIALIPFVCFTISNHTVAQSISQPDASRANQYAVPFQQERITNKSFIIPASLITTGALGISELIIKPHGRKYHSSYNNYL